MCRQIFAQGAVIDRKPVCGQLRNGFRREEQHGLPRPAMNRGMCVGVAVEAERREYAFSDRSFRDSAPGNADLEDGAGQKSRTGIPACPFSPVTRNG